MVCFAIDVTKVRVKPPKEKVKGVEASFWMLKATFLMFKPKITKNTEGYKNYPLSPIHYPLKKNAASFHHKMVEHRDGRFGFDHFVLP